MTTKTKLKLHDFKVEDGIITGTTETGAQVTRKLLDPEAVCEVGNTVETYDITFELAASGTTLGQKLDEETDSTPAVE